MAWSFTDLHYGWKIAAGISLAAVTIYVASNTRERVNQADIIELVLGTTERCLATQYSTNPVSYYVSPPSFVRSWYSNAYDGTNVILYTNTFTNVIGWRMDRAMMVELDAKIKALVPHYCDENTVYDGTTNIVMLTVTGLWASLGIGDKTNQFTSVPEWVGTNGTTKVATYGNLPWRIYKEDLEERYKVLNALKQCHYNKMIVTSTVYTAPSISFLNPYWIGTRYYTHSSLYDVDWESPWPNGIKGYVEYYYYYSPTKPSYSSPSSFTMLSSNFDGTYEWKRGWAGGVASKYCIGPFDTKVPHSVIVTARSVRVNSAVINEWSSQGSIGSEDEWVKIIYINNSFNQWHESAVYGSVDFPAWCTTPNGSHSSYAKGNQSECGYAASYDVEAVTNTYTNWTTNWIPPNLPTNYFTNYPNFQYCANAYWE